jgi:serine/threonine protein kinase
MWESSRPQQPLFPSPTAGNAPRVMGRFRCEERLAIDGPLENYRARVLGLGGFDRLFSLTCLAPGALARRPHAAEGLLRAARTAMTLKDARIAAVSESGLAPGSAFVASEFIHGVSLFELAEHLSSSTSPRALPPAVWGAVIAAIGAEIAGALVVAHGAVTPVIHGALGPTNVMVTPQGAVKLLDFGLLSAVAAPIEITLMPGRAHLMAPELRPGNMPAGAPATSSVALERPADLFALGAMLEKLAAIEAPEGPPGIGVFGPSRPMPLSLRPLLRSMMAQAAPQRPVASDAEVSFRQIVRESRGIDVGLELGTLVRLIMQLRPAQAEASSTSEGTGQSAVVSEVSDAPTRFSGASQFGRAADDQPFADEPTAILDVSADGKPSSLAAILLELRATDDEEDAASQTPTNVPQASFSDLARSNAMALQVLSRQADDVPAAPSPAGEGVFGKDARNLGSHGNNLGSHGSRSVGGNSNMPDSSATRLSAVNSSMLELSLSPSGAIAIGAPPSPDEAVMDGDLDGGELPPSALSRDAAEPNDATMVSTEAPSLEELMAPGNHTSLPFFTDEGEEHHQELRPAVEGAPTGELSNLSSGEIAASLPDPRKFHPAGFALPAPVSMAKLGSTSRDQQVPNAPASAAPEPIAFAEFSAAMPVIRAAVELKRATVTPPHWQPGNVDGPTGPHALSSSRPQSHGPRPIWAIAVAAVAVLSAIAIAILTRG